MFLNQVNLVQEAVLPSVDLAELGTKWVIHNLKGSYTNTQNSE